MQKAQFFHSYEFMPLTKEKAYKKMLCEAEPCSAETFKRNVEPIQFRLLAEALGYGLSDKDAATTFNQAVFQELLLFKKGKFGKRDCFVMEVVNEELQAGLYGVNSDDDNENDDEWLSDDEELGLSDDDCLSQDDLISNRFIFIRNNDEE
jgi:hypothetical protein